MSNITKVTKRKNSQEKYIDALQVQYSKLNIVRVDLAYRKNFSKDITLDTTDEHFTRMLNNRRSNPTIFKDNIGYICKKEYTKDKGVHIHAFFIYDGQKVQKSAYKADQIGKYWEEAITKNEGIYHNCHRNDYPENGIGMLKHNDEKKREYLDKAMVYIFKDKQSIESISSNKKRKAITRGTMPRKKSNKGRPRT